MGDPSPPRQPLDKARAILLGLATKRAGSEEVEVQNALGRITAATVRAHTASPHYRAAAMDGIAVRSADTMAAAGDNPITLGDVGSGGSPDDTPLPASAVDTGSAMPAWADSVVRIENTTRVDGGWRIAEAAPPGRDVRRIGEDMEAGRVLLGGGRRIRPFDIGAMLATSVTTVEVGRAPTVAIIATGAEVIEPGPAAQPGQVIEFNSRVMAAMIQEWGGDARYLGLAGDDEESLASAISDAAISHDIVCVIAGSSKGRRDFTVPTLARLGKLVVHGVDMMPGKPVAFASVCSTPVIAIPGYPVSAILVCRELLGPLLLAMLGACPQAVATVRAEVKRALPSKLGVEEFVRVCLTPCGGGFVVAPLPRGAGSISTIARADGILRIKAASQGIDAGSMVEVELLKTEAEAAANLVVATTHETLVETLEDLLATAHPGLPGLKPVCLDLAGPAAEVSLLAGESHLAIVEAKGMELPTLLAKAPNPPQAWLLKGLESDSRVIVMERVFAASACGKAVADTLGGGEFAKAAEAAGYAAPAALAALA
ncbi:MAG: molybdopterin-binding protein [Deltaproteobacteria bacterium]